uniref:Rhoptry neck protein RON8 n=1 Tax=Toxoplasma gondii COUG TaxID=1074873 RepID=A0A2G8XQ11_TOXGO|nr:rhoptry neck protein RON8 [Toxoplasma gondii COUG]
MVATTLHSLPSRYLYTLLMSFLFVCGALALHESPDGLPEAPDRPQNAESGDGPPTLVLTLDPEYAGKSEEFAFTAEYFPPTESSKNEDGAQQSFVETPNRRLPGTFDPMSSSDVRSEVQLRVTTQQMERGLLAEIVVLQEGQMVSGFRASLQTKEQAALLHRLADLTNDPNIHFRVEWRGRGDGTGGLYIRTAVHLLATAYKPSVHFKLNLHQTGARGARETIKLLSSVPIDDLNAPGVDIGTLKQLIVDHAEPENILTGTGSFSIKRMFKESDPKNANTQEATLVPWLLRLLDLASPVTIVGDLTRNREFSTVLPQGPANWNDLLLLYTGMGDAANRGQNAPDFAQREPGYRPGSIFLSPDGFRGAAHLGDHQPDRLKQFWRQGGETGLNPGDIEHYYSPLFGRSYDTSNNPLLILDMYGNPVYSEGGVPKFIVGPGENDLTKLPDHVSGMVLPSVSARFLFPDKRSFTEFINPARPWNDISKGWKALMAKHKMKFNYREPGLVGVSVNGNWYGLTSEFIQTYPTLLHLLGSLAQSTPGFSLEDVTLHFDDKLPPKLPTLFVLDDAHDRQIPWCAFEFVIPLSPRGTVNIKSLLAKGKSAAESPKGCNFREKGFHFTTVHRWGFVESRNPLSIQWHGVLDYTGSKQECALLGNVLKDAHLAGRQIAVSFHAEHKATVIPVIETFGPDGELLKSKPQKPVTATVQFGDDLPGFLYDFHKPFQKKKVPTVVYPFLQGQGQGSRDALNGGVLGEEYYHRPRKTKITMRPEIPILNTHDTFVDGSGPHPNVPHFVIPLTAGPQQHLAPLKALRQWLRKEYPGSQLPFKLDRMSDEDLLGIADHLVFRFPDGTEATLRSIFGPEVFSPNWATMNPDAYQKLMDVLTRPKKVYLAKNFRIVVTDVDGQQIPFDIQIEPGDTWAKTLDDFFKAHPNLKPANVKLVLYDDKDTALRQFDINLDMYASPYTEAVDQQHMKGLQITLETPAPIVSCYQADPARPGQCLAVDMKRIFCGRVNPAKMVSRAWNEECTAAWIARADLGEVEDRYLMGPDDVRARSIRDLLTSAKNALKQRNPEKAKHLNIPVADVTESEELNRKMRERTELAMKSGKTLEDLDRLRHLKFEIRTLQRQGELQWAKLVGATIRTTEKGKPAERHIRLDPKKFFLNDKLWKVFKELAAQVPGLKFENVFNFSFEVMNKEAREQWKKEQTTVTKEAKKQMRSQKTVVDVIFVGPDGSALFRDIGVELRQLSDEALGRLSKGDKRGLINQLAKRYDIPRQYFIRRGGFPSAAVNGTKWVITAMLGLVGGAGKKGLASLLKDPHAFVTHLQSAGGFSPTDTVKLVFDNGSVLDVPLSQLPDQDLGSLAEIYFPWKKTAGQAQEEKKKAVESKVAEGSGIMRKLEVTVMQPSLWPEVFGAWLSDLHEMDLFDDGPILLQVRPEGAQKGQVIRCSVKTLGELYQALNKPEIIRSKCPGMADLKKPFTFELSIRTPAEQYYKLYNRSRSPEDQRRTAAVLLKLKDHIRNLPDDGQVIFEYRKIKRTLTPQELQQLKALIEGLQPNENTDDVLTKILRLLGISDQDIAKSGRLRFGIKQAPTSSEQQMLREGSITAVVEDFQGGRRKATVRISIPEEEPLRLGASAQNYQVHMSLFSKNAQHLNTPCGSKSGAEVAKATWGQLCRWCNLKLADLPGLGHPTLYIRIISNEKTQTVRGGQPVTTNVDGHPVVYDIRMPGDPRSASGMPKSVFWNLVERPGSNELGPVWHQSIPKADGGLRKDYSYFDPNPGAWDPTLFGPSSGTFPQNTRAGIDIVTNPEAMETGDAYAPPIRFGFGFRNWNDRDAVKPQFNNMVSGIAPQERDLYKVYIQIPKGDGNYYPCSGVDINLFMQLTKEQIARACGIHPSLLEAPFGVYLLKETPTYARVQPSFPLFFVDGEGQEHPSLGHWTDAPAKFFSPHLRGASPNSLIQLEFAPGVTCNLTQQELMSLHTWEALLKRCNIDAGKERPATITTRIVPMFSTPNVTVKVPNELLQPLLRQHRGISPDQLFRQKPLEEVVALLLSNAHLGLYHVGLKYIDGTDQPYSECPEHLRQLPPSQIPGLQHIYIVPASEGEGDFPGVFRGGTLGDMMKGMNLSPQTTYGDFVRTVKKKINSPEGLTIPGVRQHVGGSGRPAQQIIDFDFAGPESPPGAAGKPGWEATWRPATVGAFPDNMPIGDIDREMHHPFLVFTTGHPPKYDLNGLAAYGGQPFREETTHLDASLRNLVEWMKDSLGISDPNGILAEIVIDTIRCPFPLSAAQLISATIGHLLHHCQVNDLEMSHSIYVTPTPVPGYTATPKRNGPQIVINGHNYGAPGTAPRDFGQLFNLPGRPGARPLNQDLEVSFSPLPGKPPVRGVLPGDVLPLLQSISDKHGQPGVAVVLNFLRQLHALAELPPGATLNIDTKLIPSQSPQQLYAPDQVPQPGPWIAGPTGGGRFPGGGVVVNESGGRRGPGGSAAVKFMPSTLRLPLLRQPSVELPRNSMLRGSIGGVGGLPRTEFVVPILPSQKSMPIEQVLKFFGIAPAAVQTLDVQEKPEQGAILIESGTVTFVPLKGPTFTVSMKKINATDKNTLATLLKAAGRSIIDLVGASDGTQPLVLKIVVDHGAVSPTKVTTPVGTPSHARSAMEGLTIWNLLPPLIDVHSVKTITIRVQAAKAFQQAAKAAAAAEGTEGDSAGEPLSRPKNVEPAVRTKFKNKIPELPAAFKPRQRTVSEINGAPNPKLVIFVEQDGQKTIRFTFPSRVNDVVIGQSTVSVVLDALLPNPGTWHRTFWGALSPDGTSCKPTMEFQYPHWLQTKMAELPVPNHSSCLLIREVSLNIKQRPNFFIKPYIFHSPLVIFALQGKQRIPIFEEQVDPAVTSQPLTALLEQLGIPKTQLDTILQCSSTNIDAPGECPSDSSTTVDPETVIPDAVATQSAFLVVTGKQKQAPGSFLQVLWRRQRRHNFIQKRITSH